MQGIIQDRRFSRLFLTVLLIVSLGGCTAPSTVTADSAATTSLIGLPAETAASAPRIAERAPGSTSSVGGAPSSSVSNEVMSDEAFWALISTLPKYVDGISSAELTLRLTIKGPDQIIAFADHLAAALYAIDHPVGADQLIRDPTAGNEPMTMGDDLFLYARCAAVAAGRAKWEQIVADPTRMAGTWHAFDGEFLLIVAPDAWQQATGTEWTHESPLSYETGSNTDNW